MRALGVMVLFAPSLALAQPASAPISASQILDAVQKANAGATNIAAEFEQDVVNTTFGTSKHSKGKVFFAKPNLFRFDYPGSKPSVPLEKAFIYDGADLWFVEPPGLKVTQMPVAASSMPAVVTFWNGGNLATQFNVAFATKSSPSAPAATAGKLVLDLVPKTPSTYSHLYLVVDAKTSTVAQSVVLDSSGDTNTFTFSAVNLAATTKPATFQFNPKTMPSTWKLVKLAPPAPPTPPAPAAAPAKASARKAPGSDIGDFPAGCSVNPLAKGC